MSAIDVREDDSPDFKMLGGRRDSKALGESGVTSFHPSLGVNFELLDCLEQTIGIGVTHATREIVFASIALHPAAIKIGR